MTCAVTTLKILPLTNILQSYCQQHAHINHHSYPCFHSHFRLWDGLQSDNGFLSQKILPLFMRTIRFLSPNFSPDHLGTSICKALELFWSKLDEESFQSSDWKVRFHSGEVCVAGSSSVVFCQVLPLTAFLSNIMLAGVPLLRMMLLRTNFNIDTHSSTMYSI